MLISSAHAQAGSGLSGAFSGEGLMGLLPIILIFMLRLVNNPRIMGVHTNPRWLNALAWGLTGLVILLTLVLFGSTLAGWLGLT